MARGARGAGRRDDDVVSVTSVPESADAEIQHRQRRYLISMGIRTVCFVGAIVAQGWLRWTLVAAALILPYIAVVMANAASPLVPGTEPERPDWDHPQLPPGAGGGPDRPDDTTRR